MADGRFHPVYPGHPLVLAIQAMEHFEDPQSALAPTGHGWCALVGSVAVSGAGDSAHNTAWLIRLIHTGELPIHSAETWANETWRRQVGPGSGNHEDQYERGLEQAVQLKGRFYEAARGWGWS